MPGRTFVDDVDFDEQLRQWMTEIADQRIHGTTHERPIDRFVEEHRHLVDTAGHPSFCLEARQPRVVAADYLVSFETSFPLVKPMPGKSMTPSLAESWSVARDGLSYEFVLRRGVKFHNGDVMTAEDVK